MEDTLTSQLRVAKSVAALNIFFELLMHTLDLQYSIIASDVEHIHSARH